MSSPIFETFPPETQRLLLLVEGNLHFIAGLPMTREQAMAVRQRFCLPLGKLTSKHGLAPVRNAVKQERMIAHSKSS